MLTPSGFIKVHCKGVKKTSSKLKNVCVPFTFAEFSLFVKEQSTLIGANLYDSFFSLSNNYLNYITACAIIDLVYNMKAEACEDFHSLFILTSNALKNLAYTNVNPKLQLLDFIINFSTLIGYKLNFNTCSNCGAKLIENEYFFKVYSGSIVCYNCALALFHKFTDSELSLIFGILNHCDLEFVNVEDSILNSLLKQFGNSIFCLTQIKLKLDGIIN